jgi:hypothetical protein
MWQSEPSDGGPGGSEARGLAFAAALSVQNDANWISFQSSLLT